MVVDDIRRENARALVDQECGGSRAEFGRRIQRPDTQVNHLIGPNHTKNIGPKLARLIESTFNKPRGWLDVRHLDELPPDAVEIGVAYARLPPSRQLVVRELFAGWGYAAPATNAEKVEHETEGS